MYGYDFAKMMTKNFERITERDIDAICHACCHYDLRKLTKEEQAKLHLDFGEKDFDWKYSKKTIPVYMPEAELVIRPGVQHCGYMAAHPKEYAEEIEAFICKKLPGWALPGIYSVKNQRKGRWFMKEKKKSDLAVLLGYTGSYKGLTFLGLGLSAVAMVLGMLPYICIWLVARDLIAVAPNWTEAAGIARYGWMAFGFAASGMMLAGTAPGRISEVMSAPVLKITDHPQVPEDNSVEFRDVSFTYAGAVFPALDHVSFKAEPGQTVALVGPSGSGKSTCARLAARLWDIDSGTICVGGVNIADIDPETLLTDYSMVFQDVVLFDDTVMENIRLDKHGASDEEVLAAAGAANCDEFVEKLPQGYATPIGENGAKLSGGERQRISIARALLKNAPIVLLDEATASLDVENETKVQGALTRLLLGKTVLVIAHRMRTVEAADKIVVLSDGKVAEEGSPAELFARENSLFRRMTQLQNASAGWSI